MTSDVPGTIILWSSSPSRIALWHNSTGWGAPGLVLLDNPSTHLLDVLPCHADGDGILDLLALLVDPGSDAVVVAVWKGSNNNHPNGYVRDVDVVLGPCGSFLPLLLDGDLDTGSDGTVWAALSDTQSVGLHGLALPLSPPPGPNSHRVPGTSELRPTHVVAHPLDDNPTVDLVLGSSFQGLVRVALRSNASLLSGLDGFHNPLFTDIAEGPGGELGGLTSILVVDADGYAPAEVFVALPSAYTIIWGQALVSGNSQPGNAPWQRFMIDSSVQDLAAVDLEADGSSLEILAAVTNLPHRGIAWSITVRDSLSFSGKRELVASSVGRVTSHDMDIDGDVDIVFSTGSSVAYLVNQDNTGGFGVRVDISTSIPSVRNFEFADLDDDGIEEFIVGARDYVRYWSILGGGSFGPPVTVGGLSGDLNTIKVGDLDLDGDLDLVMWNYKSFNVWSLAWRPNDGAGGWEAWEQISTQTLVYTGDVGDIDGDGDLDVAYVKTNDNVYWMRNNLNQTSGQMSWTRLTGVSNVGNEIRHLRLGDLNNDQVVDFAFNSHYGDRCYVAINDGQGVFTVYTLSYINEPTRMDLADVDGDGSLDVLSGSSKVSQASYWVNLESTGSSWGSTVNLASPTPSFTDIHGGDLNGDGRTDILISGATLVVMWNEPPAIRALDQSFALIEAPDIKSPRTLVSDDMDGDGTLDLVASGIGAPSAASLFVIYFAPNGSMGTPVPVATAVDVMGVAQAYISSDGLLDLVWASTTSDVVGWTAQTSPRVWASTYTTIVSLDYPRAVAVADIDGDSILDVVAVSYNDDITVWCRGTVAGGSSWALPLTVAAAVDGPVDVVVMDGDGDGDLDVVTSARNGDKVFMSVNSDGSGAFADPPTTLLSSVADPYYLTRADIDGDTDDDVLVAVYGGGDIYWIENVGGLLSTTRPLSLSTGGVLQVLANDVDSDGDVDLVYVSHSGDYIGLLTNGGDTTFGATTVLATGLDGGWNIVLHDWLYGDGYPELAVSLTGEDSVVMLETASARLIPSTVSEEDLLCTTLDCIESAINSGNKCTRRIINLLPTTISTCFSESHHAIGVRNVHLRAKNGPGTVIFSCGSSFIGSAMFLVRGLASVIVEGITFVGGNAHALSNLPLPGAWVVETDGSMLQFIDCQVVGVGGGFAFARSGGTLLLTRVSVNDTALHPLSAFARTQIPAEYQGVHGGAVVRATGEGTIVRMSDVHVVRSGAADSNTEVVGGAVLVEAHSRMKITVDGCSFVHSVGPIHAGGALAVVTGEGWDTMTGFEFVVRDTVFDGNSAVWGGTLAALQRLQDLPASALLPPSSADVYVTSVPDTLPASAASSLELVRVSVLDSSAVYGGAVFVCGSKIAASVDAGTPGLEGRVGGVGVGGSGGSGGGIGFVCHRTGGGDGGMFATAQDHPWVGDLVRWGGVGVLADAGSGYGEEWASNWVELEWVRAHSDMLTLGVAASEPALVRAVDVFGNSVVDPSARLVGRAEAMPEFAAVAGDLAAPESDVQDVMLQLATPAVLPGWRVLGLKAEVVGMTWDLVVVPERRVSGGLSVPLSSMTLQRPVGNPVTTRSCPPGLGLDMGALDPELVIVPKYTCAACGAGRVSDTLALEPCTAVVTCAEPSVAISSVQCLICPVDSTFNPTVFNQMFGNVSNPEPEEASAACICDAGFWSPWHRDPTTPCVPCPPGGVCDGSGGRPLARPGFFDVQGGGGEGFQADPKFIQCPRVAHCVGGPFDTQCRRGSGGYLCSQCNSGWFPGGDGLCDECPSVAMGLLLTIITVSVVAGVVSVVLVIMCSRGGTERKRGGRGDGSGGKRKVLPRAVGSAVVFAQVLGIIGSSEFKWPSSARSAMGMAGVTNVDPAVFATPCTLGNFYAAYVFSVSVPLVFVATTVVASLVLRPRQTIEIVRRILLTFITLFYIPLSRSALVWFDCTQLSGRGWWLDADLSVKCFDGTWMTLAPLGVAAVLLYVVLPLGLLGWVLSQNKNRLGDPGVRFRYGMLYSDFRPEYPGWLIVVLVKRLGIVVVSLFFSQLRLMLIGMLIGVFLTNLVVQAKRRPFLLENHNLLDQRLDVCIIVILMIGAGFMSEDWPNERTRDAFEIVVLAVVVIGFGFLIWSGFTEVGGWSRGVGVGSDHHQEEEEEGGVVEMMMVGGYSDEDEDSDEDDSEYEYDLLSSATARTAGTIPAIPSRLVVGEDGGGGVGGGRPRRVSSPSLVPQRMHP